MPGPVPSEHSRVLLAAPRGYCAGVDRAVVTVEKALELYGAPVYVRKQIVHNKHVVEQLERRGAVFVEELDEVPEKQIVVFSAHGVSPAVHEQASQRGLKTIDATCPLVTKVHHEARRFSAEDYDILLIGHAGHEEVEGTAGEAPLRTVIVDSPDHADTVEVRDPSRVVWLSQTTLSVDDTAEIVAVLKRRFPSIQSPGSEDICYATSNRQAAVKAIAGRCDALLVIGAANSSNSLRLVEVAEREGTRAMLVARGTDVDFGWLEGARTLGITAGASAPEVLVREVVARLAERYEVVEEPVEGVEENMVFKLPAGLKAA